MADFEKAVSLVLKHEGGYANDPRDPGGETKYGISKKSYPSLEIKTLSIEKAKEIYRRDFWNRMRGDDIANQVIANNLLDFGVTSGMGTAIAALQQAVVGSELEAGRSTKLAIDRIMGPLTMDAIRKTNAERLNLFLIKMRLNYYLGLLIKKPSRRVFFRSWINRTMEYV